jgi:hypothetical protein
LSLTGDYTLKATANVLASVTPEVRIEHKGESLSFSISVFGRDSFQGGYDVFEHINQYWATLPDVTQDEIFSIYKEIEKGFTVIPNKSELIQFTSQQVKRLIQIHDLEQIHYWICFHSDIRIPASVPDEYVRNTDNNSTEEKTYVKYEYRYLTALSMLLRCMIPVWGEYISNTRRDTGTQFKEFYAFQLLNTSEIVHSAPMEKLRKYIDKNIGIAVNEASNILNGISSEDFSYWLLSLACIRRLSTADIRGDDEHPHLVTLIYKFIIQKTRNSDSNFQNNVKEKKFDDRAADSENKVSTLERYKIKTNISLGEIVELEYACNVPQLAMRLSHRLTPELLERSLHTAQELKDKHLLDPQMTLLRWVFKHVLSPKGMMYLPKPTIVDAIGAMEAVLWSRGHKYLAILSSAYPLLEENQITLSPTDGKMRIPQEYLDRMDQLYPYTRSASSKKTQGKPVNLAVESINTLCDNLSMFTWKPTAHPEMLQEVLGTTARKLPIIPDIKTDICKLVIEIGERSYI